MKALSKLPLVVMSAAALSLALVSTTSYAADSSEKESPTKVFMKKYHKAPQGVDPVSKRAAAGKATPQELKELAAGYHAMMKDTPPKGDAASWKEKTTKLASAADALVKGEPDAQARFKEASNCKVCHDAHKPKN